MKTYIYRIMISGGMENIMRKLRIELNNPQTKWEYIMGETEYFDQGQYSVRRDNILYNKQVILACERVSGFFGYPSQPLFIEEVTPEQFAIWRELLGESVTVVSEQVFN